MQNIKTTKITLWFIIICSIWLPPAILPTGAGASRRRHLSPVNSIEDLKSRRAAIESMTDIDETVMADSLNQYG